MSDMSELGCSIADIHFGQKNYKKNMLICLVDSLNMYLILNKL